MIETVWLDNPPVNAVNSGIIDTLWSALENLGDDVRAVVLRGRGERAFSAGADISGFVGGVSEGDRPGGIQPVADLIEAAPVPVVAAIHFNNVWAALGKPVSVFGYGDHPEWGHHIGGSDASGVVWSVGPGVTKWKPGDEVVLHCNQASYEDVEVHGLDPLAAVKPDSMQRLRFSTSRTSTSCDDDLYRSAVLDLDNTENLLQHT